MQKSFASCSGQLLSFTVKIKLETCVIHEVEGFLRRKDVDDDLILPDNPCESWRSISYRFVCLNWYKRTYLNLSSRFRGSVTHRCSICGRSHPVDMQRTCLCGCSSYLWLSSSSTSGSRGVTRVPDGLFSSQPLRRLKWKAKSSQFSSSIHRNSFRKIFCMSSLISIIPEITRSHVNLRRALTPQR